MKDEDYRYSFLFGNYLTLVGFTSRDLDCVLQQRLSPLYVSIHATDPIVRGRLLGLKRAPILPMLKKLIDGGIEIHGQIVLLPGWNDGEVLQRSLEDLAPLYPGLASLSIVPVGLTRHRKTLESLRLLNREDARKALSAVDFFQRRMLKSHGSRWIFPADELLLLVGHPIPTTAEYEGYPQMENGVGLCRWTMDQAADALKKMRAPFPPARRLLWVTGRSAEPILKVIASALCRRIKGLGISVFAVENTLLGSTVTVASLLGGRDLCLGIRKFLEENPAWTIDKVYLPPDCLNSESLLLDDWTVADLESRINLPVQAFNGDWKRMILGDKSAVPR